MKKSGNPFYFFPKTGAASALMFSLALLILVVSCPLKRLLTDGMATSTSVPRSNQTNNNQHSVKNYSDEFNSCSISDRPVFTSDLLHTVKVQAPVYFQNIFNEPGYNIHYFLSGINYRYHSSTASLNSPLPLFLQHLRLLI
jgi:hypothetical protein